MITSASITCHSPGAGFWLRPVDHAARPGVAASPRCAVHRKCRRVVGQADSSSSIPRCQAAVCSTSLNVKTWRTRTSATGIREHRAPSRSRNASGPNEPPRTRCPSKLLVLLQVASGVRDADPRGHLHQLRDVRDAGDARDAPASVMPGVADPPIQRVDRGRVEAHLRWSCTIACALLRAERLEQAVVRDVRVAFRIARHADRPRTGGPARPSPAAASTRRGARPGPSRPRPPRRPGGARAPAHASSRSARCGPVPEHVRRQMRRHVVADRRDASARSIVASIPWVGEAVTVTRRRGERLGALERVRSGISS